MARTWVNGGPPALNATNLNALEADVTAKLNVTDAQTTYVAKVDAISLPGTAPTATGQVLSNTSTTSPYGLAWSTPSAGNGADTVTTVAAAGAAQTLTLPTGNLGTYDLTLTAATCTLTLAGATAGKAANLTILLRQDGTGGRLVTWPGSVVWAAGAAPVLSTSSNRIDVVSLLSVDGGTSWLGSLVGAAFAPPALPSAPTAVSAAPGDTVATVTWTGPAGASPAITNYKVYRGTSAGTTTLIGTVGAVLTYNDSGLTNGTGYYYQVTAVNSVGESAKSTAAGPYTPAATASTLPTTATAAALWFKADSLALADGAAVTSWTDSSATAAPAVQATTANQPIYKTNIIAGKPVVRFDGVNDKLTSTKIWDRGFSALAVVRQSSTGTDDDILSGPPTSYTLRINAAGKLEILQTNTQGMVAAAATVPSPTTTFNVVGARVNLGDGSSTRLVRLSVNAVNDSGTVSGYTGASLAISIGANGDPGEWFAGDIAEIVYYPVELSDTDYNAVKSYLGSKYGITVV